jgi:hypothetical protein
LPAASRRARNLDKIATVKLLAWLVAFLPACASAPATTGRGDMHLNAKLDENAPLAVHGARCTNGVCACRDVDDWGRGVREPERDIAEGTKRFELRTGRTQDPLVIAIEGQGALKKPTDTVQAACGYVDLAPGKYRVRLRASANSPEAGMVPSLFIREYGARTQDWYDTFEFRCGGGDACSIGHMEEWLGNTQRDARGLHDPCGSVRVGGLRWNAERTVGVKLSELVVELTLDVYKFPPRFPHGAKKCHGAGGVSAEQVEDAPTPRE